MARTAEDWSDLYYEQQALHTEETGIQRQEIAKLKSDLEVANARLEMVAEVEIQGFERSSAFEAASVLLKALGWGSGGLGAAAIEVVKQRDDAIRALSEASRWVPVSERLPEATHGAQFLTFSIEWGRTVRTFEERGTYRGFCWRDEGGEHVTHWMPLSEPPK